MEKDVREVDLVRVSPNIRFIFTNESIDELCSCIKASGETEPILIWLAGDTFRILDGEKRWRACKRLGLRRIRAVIVGESAVLGE